MLTENQATCLLTSHTPQSHTKFERGVWLPCTVQGVLVPENLAQPIRFKIFKRGVLCHQHSSAAMNVMQLQLMIEFHRNN